MTRDVDELMGFRVGDAVRIRTWDDMVEEFGINDYGHIPCKFTFTDTMGYLCGKEFEISRIEADGAIHGHSFSYTISVDMIEKTDFELEYDYAMLDEFLDGIYIKGDM